MDAPIIPIASIQALAREDFEKGGALSDRPFNWHAAARPHYEAEWKRCAQAQPQAQVAEP